MQWHDGACHIPGTGESSVRLKHKVCGRGVNNEAGKVHNGLLLGA